VGECLTGMAMRKKGLTNKHYIRPLSTDHGQGKKYRLRWRGRSGSRRIAILQALALNALT
jgi:hypothetical protein